MPPRSRGFVVASRALNVLTFGSWREMFCSRAWRRGWWPAIHACDAVFFAFWGEERHCLGCWEHDYLRGVAGPVLWNLSNLS